MNNYNNPPIVVKSGTYAGNDTENRGIPHGLGRVPRFVFIEQSGTANIHHILTNQLIYNTSAVWLVTAMDAINFYVGDSGSYAQSANNTGQTYKWVAL